MKDTFDVDEFIMQGQIQIIDKIKDFYYDELPDGWSQHFVDEIRYFDDGFYTIRYHDNTPVIYHFFVDTESRGKGVATRQLKKMYNEGYNVFFDINDALDSVMGKLEEDEGIFFTDILYEMEMY